MAADLTQPWLEDLSEEWIPQPTPPARPLPTPTHSTAITQSAPPKPRSRLPRPRQKSGSFSDPRTRSLVPDLPPSSLSRALPDRSLSEPSILADASLNASHTDTSHTDADADADASHPDVDASHSFASDSQGSFMYGTVAVSPSKQPASTDTPEWRRRLVYGQGCDQKDLFGPTGLENIFQKPTGSTAESAEQPKRKLGLLRGLSVVPSSPPPWPAADPDVTPAPSDSRPDSKDGQHHRQDSQQELPSQSQATDSSFSMLAPPIQEPPRTVSGQIEFENEQFSPVFINTNLAISQTPQPATNFRGSELANRLRQIGSPPPSQFDSIPDESRLTNIREDSSFSRLQDESLPEGLPAGTPDIADVGRFVELRRGGYSREGSFRRRPLSPSPERNSPVPTPSRNVVVRSAKSESRKNSANEVSPTDEEISPKTPRRNGNQFLSPERAQHAGSPLKLFDAHDTFTSNRLQRRLSQLENKPDLTTPSSVQDSKAEVPRPVQKTSRLTSVEEVSMLRSEGPSALNEQRQSPRKAGTFGEGQLNQYEFSGDYSAFSSESSDVQSSAPDESPSEDIAPPGSRPPFRFHVEGSPLSREPSMTKRQASGRVSNPFRVVSKAEPRFQRHVSPPRAPETAGEDDHQEYGDGKRGPTSPFKNPTPKRRRTINSAHEESDEENNVTGNTEPPATKVPPVAAQLVVGRKREDARPETSSKSADPQVLAQRHILRPRNPTPSQRRREEIEAEILEATEAFIQSSPKLNTIREQLEPSIASTSAEEDRAAAVANEVAMFSMKRQAMRNQTRKRSVTTQDFLDEALKIMNFIRTKGRPTSGLGDLEETDAEFAAMEGESEQASSSAVEGESEQASSSLTLERPPTREGHLPAWREPNKRQLDPSVMNHLRKYEEKESDTFLNSSLHSLHFSQTRDPPSDGHSFAIERDNIRVTTDPTRRFKPEYIEDEYNDNRPQTGQSAGSSLGHTVATNASRRSDQVATLAPQAIAHLIPQEVAGMSFNREKNMWVRHKNTLKVYRRPEEEHSSMNQSEEDPFGNIPDLTVDETKEQVANAEAPAHPQPTAETILEDEELEDEARPMTREGKGTAFTDTSSVPSKVSNFGWSYPKTETRATSCSTQVPRKWSTQKAPQLQTTYAIPESDEDVEHEIQYFEGRAKATPTVPRTRVRDITISFAERKAHDPDSRPGSISQRYGREQRAYSNIEQPSHTRTKTWGQLNEGTSLPGTLPSQRPAFYRDSDLSVLEELPSKNYMVELSMSVSAAALGHGKQDALLAASSSPAKGDVTFMLSELPEFTLNQVDELEMVNRVIVKHDGTQFSKTLEDRYAQGTAELVKALQDEEPDEPYWEDLREVKLRGKGLTTLHRLGTFCGRLEELDVSNNSLSQVEGIPYSVRRLQAQNNCLTGLTPWTTLANLQHLDLTGNDIDNLDGLSELVHLRVLKVDNNKLKSLDSILHLDGLMELSVGGNEIEFVDFARSNLKSLTNLNMRNNCIAEVRNLYRLPQLQHLDIDDNEIAEFPTFDAAAEQCKSLRTLRLCRNGTTSLDVDGHFPKLEALYVDGNCLTHVSGLEHLRYLRTFSAREQVLDTELDAETCVNNLVRNTDVHNLYISLNPVHGLRISQHLLNLQRLELASMGLKELPDNFGQLTPNIRSVNLNFNSLQDIRPLLNIKRLDELLLVGNKLERLRTNAMVLGKLGTISRLDWRDNPLTLRFYGSASELRVMSLRQDPSDEQFTDRFVLPAGDAEADIQHLLRLDYETRIRRRVIEMMLANFCKNLKELDGLPFDKARILVKDDVWERLQFLGVIRRKQPESTNDECDK